MAEIGKIDVNMEVPGDALPGKKFYNPGEAPFRLTGFEYFEKDHVFRRLPLKSRELMDSVNPNINELCEMTAGGQILFKTDSTEITVRAKLVQAPYMSHMTGTGQGGFDCYLKEPGDKFRFRGVTRFECGTDEYTCSLVENLEPGVMRGVTIYFPLYCGVKSVEIGLDENAGICAPDDFPNKGKLVFYGTSIMQGGCATRPGLAYTSILSRRLEMEHVNFGFSGNGLGEPEIAELLARVSNPALYLIDYEANGGTNGRLEATLKDFIAIIREKQAYTPIVIVSRFPYIMDLYDNDTAALRSRLRDFQKETVENCRRQGDNKIYFIDGSTLLDDNFDDYTIDTIHPTDLGFWKLAEALYWPLKKILQGNI